LLIPLLANSHIFEISEDDHPRLVTHARDHWWTLDFANASLSPGVNSGVEVVPSPRANVRSAVGSGMSFEQFGIIGRMLWPRKVPRKRFSFHLSWNWNIFTGANTFEHAEFKSEKFPLRKPAVFSQTAILSSLISRLFSLFNDTDRWRQTIMSLKKTNFY
jgi:hypothetical protein